MGERLLCKQEGDGSIPFTSTSLIVGRTPLPSVGTTGARLGAGLARRRRLFTIVNKDTWDTVAQGEDQVPACSSVRVVR